MLSDAWRNIVAGTCGGMASISVCHPLDTIRTRLQTGKYISAWHCFRVTLRLEGFAALYKGLLLPFIAQGVYKATMFGVYGAATRYVSKKRAGNVELSASEVFVCGALAGGSNALVLTPVELVRNRLQISNATGTKFRDVVSQASSEAGGSIFRGLWRGLGATLWRDVPGVGAYFACFELARQHAARRHGPETKLTVLELAGAGAIGGCAFWTVALPFDHVKSRIQVNRCSNGPSTASALLSVLRNGGLARLYVGYGSALVRGIPGAAIAFGVYGAADQWLLERA